MLYSYVGSAVLTATATVGLAGLRMGRAGGRPGEPTHHGAVGLIAAHCPRRPQSTRPAPHTLRRQLASTHRLGATHWRPALGGPSPALLMAEAEIVYVAPAVWGGIAKRTCGKSKQGKRRQCTGHDRHRAGSRQYPHRSAHAQMPRDSPLVRPPCPDRQTEVRRQTSART